MDWARNRIEPLDFGRRARAVATPAGRPESALAWADVRLFLSTFAAGFLFMTVFLA